MAADSDLSDIRRNFVSIVASPVARKSSERSLSAPQHRQNRSKQGAPGRPHSQPRMQHGMRPLVPGEHPGPPPTAVFQPAGMPGVYASSACSTASSCPPLRFAPKAVGYAGETKLATLDIKQRVTTIVLIVGLTVYAMPLYLCYHVGSDPNVQRWFGGYILWPVFFTPVAFAFMHGYHMHFRRASRFWAIICLLGSSVGILVASDRLALSAVDLGSQLYARDCEIFQHKYDLQREWDAAHVYFANCLARVSQAQGISFETLAAIWFIDECPDYEDVSRKHPDWAYLAQVEREHACSGWCSHGQPLWSRGSVKDSCSHAVAEVMKSKVEYCMMQNVIYSIVLLGIVASSLMTLQPSIWAQAQPSAGLDLPAGHQSKAPMSWTTFSPAACPAEFGALR